MCSPCSETSLGQSHSSQPQYGAKVGVVPVRPLAFDEHTSFAQFLAHHVQRNVAEYGRVLRRVAHPNAVLVFVEGHIQHPMHALLDPPMPQSCFSTAGGTRVARQILPAFRRGHVAHLSLDGNHPLSLLIPPLRRGIKIGEIRRLRDQGVPPRFEPPVPLLDAGHLRVCHARASSAAYRKVSYTSFLLHHLLCNRLLTTQRVNRDGAAAQVLDVASVASCPTTKPLWAPHAQTICSVAVPLAALCEPASVVPSMAMIAPWVCCGIKRIHARNPARHWSEARAANARLKVSCEGMPFGSASIGLSHARRACPTPRF